MNVNDYVDRLDNTVQFKIGINGGPAFKINK